MQTICICVSTGISAVKRKKKDSKKGFYNKNLRRKTVKETKWNSAIFSTFTITLTLIHLVCRGIWKLWKPKALNLTFEFSFLSSPLLMALKSIVNSAYFHGSRYLLIFTVRWKTKTCKKNNMAPLVTHKAKVYISTW